MSNQDQQPPWGKKHKPQTPEEIVAQLINKLQDFFSDKKKPPAPRETTRTHLHPLLPLLPMWANYWPLSSLSLFCRGSIHLFSRSLPVKWGLFFDSANIHERHLRSAFQNSLY